MRYQLLILLLVSIVTSSHSQNDSTRTYQLGIKRGYGFIITHDPTMEYMTEQHNNKFEIYIEQNTFGNKAWYQRYGFLRIGLAFNYFDFNNENHLGKGYSLHPYFNFKVIGNENIQLRLKPGIGIGYLETPFDVNTNFKNSAIGSHFNIFVSILAEAEFKLTKQTGLLIGTNFSHYSNTGFKTPNLGINIPTIEAGIFHRIGKTQARTIIDEPTYKRQKSHWIIYTGIGLNEIYPPNEKKYVASGISIAKEKKLNYKSSIAGGLDLFYNPAQVAALENSSAPINEGFENLRIGLSFHHVLHFGKLSNYVQIGYYLQTKDEELGDLYQIVGGRYEINKRFDALLALKTHLSRAEYIMLGLGLKFGKDEK